MRTTPPLLVLVSVYVVLLQCTPAEAMEIDTLKKVEDDTQNFDAIERCAVAAAALRGTNECYSSAENMFLALTSPKEFEERRQLELESRMLKPRSGNDDWATRQHSCSAKAFKTFMKQIKTRAVDGPVAVRMRVAQSEDRPLRFRVYFQHEFVLVYDSSKQHNNCKLLQSCAGKMLEAPLLSELFKSGFSVRQWIAGTSPVSDNEHVSAAREHFLHMSPSAAQDWLKSVFRFVGKLRKQGTHGRFKHTQRATEARDLAKALFGIVLSEQLGGDSVFVCPPETCSVYFAFELGSVVE
eukprot:gnl/Spiro4/27187_TR13523_c0_g1_i1.p1 gnl/Spiro4/27187_TR13523_c0_g1~~gnl/Spiro4/27187_TR13523_c0_g1_i1.p1  ORF type:complete len:296 (+),score=82.21 gnl/Spiro4/27187_TR13523_c0_g1_i1:39-926(+)